MTNARMIEYQITRELLQRRENAAQQQGTDHFIRCLALAAGIAVIGLALPHVLLPVFLTSAVVTLGL